MKPLLTMLVMPTISPMLAGGIGFAVLSFALLKRGIWPKRKGKTPHCRHCGYNLTAAPSVHCPECGNPITPVSLIYGERRRNPYLIALGLLGLGLSCLALVRVARQYDWYHIRPAAWVLLDLRSTNATVADRAWHELMRRDKTASLPVSQWNALIAFCLKEQVLPLKHSLWDAMVNYLGDCAVDDRLSDQQRKQFFEQILTFGLAVQPRTLAGEPVHFDTPWDFNRGPSAFWLRLEQCPLMIDGVATGDVLYPAKDESAYAGIGSWMGRPYRRKLGVGRHTLGTQTRVLYFKGEFKDQKKSRLLYTQDLKLEQEFMVVAREVKDRSLTALSSEPSTATGP